MYLASGAVIEKCHKGTMAVTSEFRSSGTILPNRYLDYIHYWSAKVTILYLCKKPCNIIDLVLPI